jgi:predicted exporter
MIEIRFTGTRDELNQALSITRNDYKVLAKTKPQQLPTDPLRWSIHIKAELKSNDAELSPSASTAALTGHDAPETRQKSLETTHDVRE